MFKSKYQQNKRLKIRIPGRVRKIAISAVVLLVTILGAGTAYTLFSSNDYTPPSAPTVEDKAIEDAPKVYKPAKPAVNAREWVALVSLLSPVKAGDNTSMSISTNASSNCSIVVTYDNTVSKDSGLASKQSDDYGSVSWTWTVDKSAPAGTWPVKVTCAYNKSSGVLIADLGVTK